MTPTTDPTDLPGADPHTGQRAVDPVTDVLSVAGPHAGGQGVDPVTGYETTGHDWGGIKELNTPFPRLAAWALGITVAYAVIAWVLLPAWPTGGGTYTPGLLGLDQGEVAVQRFQQIDEQRQDWLSKFAEPDFAALSGDEVLMAQAMPAAHRLFIDNCSACHGEVGQGGPGFPVLNDGVWYWGGEPEIIAETLVVGINSGHPDTRIAQMPVFDWLERADRRLLVDYVVALPAGPVDHSGPAGVLFEENCASCHGERGVGNLMVGAPPLVDASVIYGQDPVTVVDILRHGRQGVMPSWSDRLSTEKINLLALYVSRLSAGTVVPAP